MNLFFYVAIWVIPSVLVGYGVGVYVGRGMQTKSDAKNVKRDREETLQALLHVLKATEQLTNDVDLHNAGLENVGRCVGDLELDGELKEIQLTLLEEVAKLRESNKRLENDLTYTRCQLEKQAQELDRTRKEALTDALSGVANRKGFDEQLTFLFSQLRRDQVPFSLLLADVDKFKWINDTHGHQAGDRVVNNMAQLLRECVRPTDYVARFGGDEFAVLFSGADERTAKPVAERLRMIVEQHNFDYGLGGERIAITFSMGLSSAREQDTPETLIERADKALYKAKQEGRNRLCVQQDLPATPAPAESEDTEVTYETHAKVG